MRQSVRPFEIGTTVLAIIIRRAPPCVDSQGQRFGFTCIRHPSRINRVGPGLLSDSFRFARIATKPSVVDLRLIGLETDIEPVSARFEPSLQGNYPDIENWRPETGARNLPIATKNLETYASETA